MNIKFTTDDLKVFIWPAIGILITLVLLVAVIIPQIFSIIKTNLEILEKKALSKDLQNKAVILGGINLNQYKEDFSKLSVALPLSSDIPSAISQLQMLTAASSVTIKSFAITVPSSASADSFQMRIELEGNIEDINKFISDLKSSSRIFVLNRVEMVGSRSSTVYQASITLTTYFQPIQTTLSPIDQEIQPLSSEDLAEIATISRNVSKNQGVSEATTTGPKGKSNPFQ